MANHKWYHTTMAHGRRPPTLKQHTSRPQSTPTYTIPHKYSKTTNHPSLRYIPQLYPTKDNKSIHPLLNFTNLKISMQESNPDKDILVNKPTIQIQASLTHVYNQSGNHVATITTDRLQWLWNQYSHNNLPHLTNFLQPLPQDFKMDILWLIQAYSLRKNQKNIHPDNNHHTLHLDISCLLIDSFKITHSYYSSPLTCPTQLTQYNSSHNQDIIFGSLRHAQSSMWKKDRLAYPQTI